MKDLGEPREASRFLRRNKSRVWLASLLESRQQKCSAQKETRPARAAHISTTILTMTHVTKRTQENSSKNQNTIPISEPIPKTGKLPSPQNCHPDRSGRDAGAATQSKDPYEHRETQPSGAGATPAAFDFEFRALEAVADRQATKPRSGERMQPTPQGVGHENKISIKPRRGGRNHVNQGNVTPPTVAPKSLVSATSFPPFANPAKSGAPTGELCRQTKMPGPLPCRSTLGNVSSVPEFPPMISV